MFYAQGGLFESLLSQISSIGTFNTALPGANCALGYSAPSVIFLRHSLSESLKSRVLSVPEPSDVPSDIDTRVAVLFYGGLDCTILVRLIHEVLPLGQGIDLINVAFENPRQVAIFAKLPNQPKGGFYESCPDRITGRKSFAELKAACPGRYIRFIAVWTSIGRSRRHAR